MGKRGSTRLVKARKPGGTGRKAAKAGVAEPANVSSASDLVRTTWSDAPGTPVHTLDRALGSRIRLSRRHQDLTVAQLAAAAGISAGMLSRIETGQITPSLATLQCVTDALSLPLSTLFSSIEEKRDCYFIQSGQGTTINRRGTKVGHHYQRLGNTLAGDVGFEPYIVTLGDDAEPYSEFQHAGVEIVYLLSGEVAYRHGDQKYHLRPGDSLLFDAAAHHGPERIIKRPVVYFSVISYLRNP